MLFFVCYVGYEYAMCNFTLNKLCYVMLCVQCYVMCLGGKCLRKDHTHWDQFVDLSKHCHK